MCTLIFISLFENYIGEQLKNVEYRVCVHKGHSEFKEICRDYQGWEIK